MKYAKEKPRSTFMQKIRFVLIIAAVFYATTYLIPGMHGSTATRLQESGMMAVIEAAYNNPQALDADMQEMDRRSRESTDAGARYFTNTIYRRVMTAFLASVSNAPDDAVISYYELQDDMYRALQNAPPEACQSLFSALQNPQHPNTDNMLELGGYADDVIKDKRALFQAQADMINGARENPSPLRVPPAQAVQMFNDNFTRFAQSRGKVGLLQRVSAGTASAAEQCQALMLVSEAVVSAPSNIRVIIMKGGLLAAAYSH